MLALLSDLHFCDETAVERNVAPAAFRIALDSIYKMALELQRATQAEVPLDVVFLGDIFDLLRSERWFEQGPVLVPPRERPWGSAAALGTTRPPEVVLGHARGILEAAIQKNEQALATLRQKRPELDGKVRVRRFLVTGNHDRLSLHDDRLHVRMREALGAEDERTLNAPGFGTHGLMLPEYGLLARHGHEWDAWNFNRVPDAAPPGMLAGTDYLPAPIGDPITTEIAVRLPLEMRRRLADARALSPEQVASIHARLQHIEDVRPVVTALQWAFQEVDEVSRSLGPDQRGALLDALDGSVATIVREFQALDYYRAWQDGHRLFHLDTQALLRDLFELLGAFRARTFAGLAPHFAKLADKLEDSAGRDVFREGARKEALDALGRGGLRHVIYGHTHDAAFAPLRARDTYLNTGTFRRRIFHADDHQGFADAELLTYVCLFTRDEAKVGWGGDGPAYTTWTGTRTPG